MPDDLIDPTTFSSLVESVGEDFIQELVAAFLEDTPVQLAWLRRAYQDGDPEIFRRSAHTIKSTGLNFGATRLAERARELEEMGRSGSLEGGAARIEELEALYRRVQLELKEMGYA